MPQSPSRLTAIIAATAAAGFSGAAIAGATGSGSGRGVGETALTGETKQKVEAAALAKVPGTVLRTETADRGVYESHIRKGDGTEVEVKVGKDFTVTAVEEHPGGMRGGPGGPGGPGRHADLAAVAKDLGVTEAKLTSALASARPATPSDARDRGADLAAAIAEALGEKSGDVQAVLEAGRPDGGRHGPGGPDPSPLVTALADRFSVSEAKARSAVDAAMKAHDAEHVQRETAMYAAVANALGKDAAAVKQAFEAHR